MNAKKDFVMKLVLMPMEALSATAHLVIIFVLTMLEAFPAAAWTAIACRVMESLAWVSLVVKSEN